MLHESTIKQIITGLLIAVLLVFTFFIIKPIFLPIVLGLILAYTFSPINNFIYKRLKNKTASAVITCISVVALLALIIWFTIPILIEQLFQSYVTIQSFDLVGFLKKVFPPLFTSQQVSASFGAAYSNFLSGAINTSLEKLTGIFVNLPSFVLKLIVVLITLFYGLRDGDKLIELLKSTLPFNRATTSKFIQKSKQVTFSVVYGRVIIGIVTGSLAGIGFFFAGVDKALLLTVLTMFVSIIPLIGPWIIWVPVVVGLFFAGKTLAAAILLIYCLLIVTLFENIATPILVSKRSQIPTSLTLLSLIGGILVFGLFGIILGPLIVAYLLILFELYREYSLSKRD